MIESNPTKEDNSSTQSEARAVAHVDLDRYCGCCGYNLRTLAVYRDEHTGIPLVRCPECGTFHPANDMATALRPWLHRICALALGGWILTLLSVFFLLGLAAGATTYGTLDELTTYGGTQVTRIGNQTTYTYSGGLRVPEVREPRPEDKYFVAFMLASSFVNAFLTAMVAVLAFPHWRRHWYLALVLPLALVANVIAALTWHFEAPHLFTWGIGFIVAHGCVQLLGGIVGINAGRPLARLAVRIFLPPRVRPHLAYIWLADNKPFPSSL